VRVPLDYRSPGGPQIALSVSRVCAQRPQARHGALLLVPGGPGGSSLAEPAALAGRLPQRLRDEYDLVGFDPRGVGNSAPVSCGLTHDDLATVKIRSWPAPGGDITGNVADARRVAAVCARDGGPVIRSISTANEARDIDRIRETLGEPRISLWGVSYGTYVGAVYVQLFPDRTDRVVLDSNDDPDPSRVARQWLANYATGVQDRFPDFARWAADPANPDRLTGDAAAVRPMFLALADRLDRTPIPWPGANPPELDGNVLREALLDDLYSDDRFPDLARLIRAARDWTPGTALPPAQSPPDDAVRNNVAVVVATICGDVAWPTSIPGYARAVEASRRSHPLTAGMPVNIGPCAFWPYPPAEPPVRITPDGPSNVLLVQNLRDPATPYSGAMEMRRALGDRARLVTVDSGGHEAYLAHGNACGDRLVTEFLATGRRPARDAFCSAGAR
jgi:pimeloyl-ACP methyl ester carboxylesterase